MTEQDIEAMKRNIEAQLSEYAQAKIAYETWLRDWQRRQAQRRFRCADAGNVPA